MLSYCRKRGSFVCISQKLGSFLQMVTQNMAHTCGVKSDLFRHLFTSTAVSKSIYFFFFKKCLFSSHVRKRALSYCLIHVPWCESKFGPWPAHELYALFHNATRTIQVHRWYSNNSINDVQREGLKRVVPYLCLS